MWWKNDDQWPPWKHTAIEIKLNDSTIWRKIILCNHIQNYYRLFRNSNKDLTVHKNWGRKLLFASSVYFSRMRWILLSLWSLIFNGNFFKFVYIHLWVCIHIIDYWQHSYILPIASTCNVYKYCCCCCWYEFIRYTINRAKIHRAIAFIEHIHSLTLFISRLVVRHILLFLFFFSLFYCSISCDFYERFVFSFFCG